jgi:4,5-dihydroxyphthalate decarboxylase
LAASNLRVSLILSRNSRTEPIINGEVHAQGIDLSVTVAHPSEMFWRQLHHAEFDAGEMSLSSLMIARSRGDHRFAGLPVFTTRRFFHTWILVRTDRGIEKPGDLKGKRVGVPEYQQTAAVWSRGVLRHEFGVHPHEMEWFMERTDARSHGSATGFVPPAGVRVNRIPANENIGTLMASGELDATLLYFREPNLVDRSTIDLTKHPQIRPLFPDAACEGARYFAKTGLYPVNHCVAIQQSLLDRHPWVATNLYHAFVEAKDRWRARGNDLIDTHIETGILPISAGQAAKRDPYAYGAQANRAVLETLAGYSHEQGLTPRVAVLEEIFSPSSLDL